MSKSHWYCNATSNTTKSTQVFDIIISDFLNLESLECSIHEINNNQRANAINSTEQELVYLEFFFFFPLNSFIKFVRSGQWVELDLGFDK